MGWDYRHTASPVRRSAECRSEISDRYEILKDRLVGSTWYAALRNKQTGKVHAAVVLTKVNSGEYCNFGIKFMDEEMGPYYYDCPESILKLLSPTTDKHALEWREKCRTIAETRRILQKAPYGSRLHVTLDDGSTRTVIKRKPGYQFRSWWLLVEHQGRYIRKNRVTAVEPTLMSETELLF